MTDLFYTVLNMSVCGLVAALAMGLIITLFWRTRCSKTALLLLWAVAAFRLLCPWSPPSPISLFNWTAVGQYASQAVETIYTGDVQQAVSYPDAPDENFERAVSAGVEPVQNESTGLWEVHYYEDDVGAITPAKTVWEIYSPILAAAWLIGAAGFLAYGVGSYVLLCRRLQFAVRDETLPNVWYSDRIQSPCVAGLFRPQICLTFGMSETEKSYVLAHEYQHIKNGDHIWKILGWLVMCVHWFNLLLWVIYLNVFLRTLEEACDQRVLRQLGRDKKEDYGQALLALSSGRRFHLTPSPIAFGEGGTKTRVKSILKYKKPLAWLTAIALVLAVAVSVCVLTSRAEDEPTAGTESGGDLISRVEDESTVGMESSGDLISYSDTYSSHAYFGTVTAVKSDSLLLVEVENIGPVYISWNTVSEYHVGDFVMIAARGGLRETYPASFSEVTQVARLSEPLTIWPVDLTHDGADETITVFTDSEFSGAYYITVTDVTGMILWADSAATAHAGQNGIYLYQQDDQYYLMQWVPYSQMGWYNAHYKIFSLSEQGEELALAESSIEFSIDDPMSVDTAALRKLENEITGYLANSVVLLSTNYDTPSGIYYSTPDAPITPMLENGIMGSYPSVEEFETFQALTQGTYTFDGKVVSVEADHIMVQNMSLWFTIDDENLVFSIPVDDPSSYQEDDIVQITADGPLYRWELPDEGTTVTITPRIVSHPLQGN